MKRKSENGTHRRVESKYPPFTAAAFTAVLFILLLPVTAHSQNNVTALNRELSFKYTQLAFEEFQKEKYDESRGFMQSALVFWPENPDALYINAVIESRDGNYDHTLAILPMVFNGNPLQHFQRNEALEFYLRNLITFDQASQALMLLSVMPGEAVLDRELLELKARALVVNGMHETLMETLSTGVRLFPESDLLQSLLVEYSAEYRRNTRRKILSEGKSEIYGQQTLKNIIAHSIIPSQRVRLLDIYVQEWGRDQYAAVYYLVSGDSSDAGELAAVLGMEEKIPEELIEALWTHLRDIGQEQIFRQAFETYSGTVQRDTDGDGYFEIDEIYLEGMVKEVHANMNGDPEAEARIGFNMGTPATFSVRRRDGSLIEGTYRRYPELESVTMPGGGSALLRIDLVPYAVSYPLNGWKQYHFPAAVPLPDAEDFPHLYKLLTNAAEVRTVESDTVIAQFDRGISSVEVLQNDVVRMQGELVGATVEERRRDVDGDGYFEIREYYKSGQLVRITYDGNQNSIPEYIEEYNGNLIKKWDTDEDGAVDYQKQEIRN